MSGRMSVWLILFPFCWRSFLFSPSISIFFPPPLFSQKSHKKKSQYPSHMKTEAEGSSPFHFNFNSHSMEFPLFLNIRILFSWCPFSLLLWTMQRVDVMVHLSRNDSYSCFMLIQKIMRGQMTTFKSEWIAIICICSSIILSLDCSCIRLQLERKVWCESGRCWDVPMGSSSEKKATHAFPIHWLVLIILSLLWWCVASHTHSSKPSIHQEENSACDPWCWSSWCWCSRRVSSLFSMMIFSIVFTSWLLAVNVWRLLSPKILSFRKWLTPSFLVRHLYISRSLSLSLLSGYQGWCTFDDFAHFVGEKEK